MGGVSAHCYCSHIYRYYYHQLSSSVTSWLISGDIDDQLPSKSVSCTGFQSSGSDVLVEVFILSIGGVFQNQTACYRLPSQLFLTNRFVAVLASVLKIKRATWWALCNMIGNGTHPSEHVNLLSWQDFIFFERFFFFTPWGLPPHTGLSAARVLPFLVYSSFERPFLHYSWTEYDENWKAYTTHMCRQ